MVVIIRQKSIIVKPGYHKNQSVKIYVDSITSTAVGLDPSLHALADHADHQGVLAAVHAERDTAADAGEEEQGKAPDPCDSSWRLLREVLSFSPAEGTGQSSSVRRKALVVVGLETLILIRVRRWHEALVALIRRVSLIGNALVVPARRKLIVRILLSGRWRRLVGEKGLIGNIRIGIDSAIVHDMILCNQIIVRFMIERFISTVYSSFLKGDNPTPKKVGKDSSLPAFLLSKKLQF